MVWHTLAKPIYRPIPIPKLYRSLTAEPSRNSSGSSKNHPRTNESPVNFFFFTRSKILKSRTSEFFTSQNVKALHMCKIASWYGKRYCTLWKRKSVSKKICAFIEQLAQDIFKFSVAKPFKPLASNSFYIV